MFGYQLYNGSIVKSDFLRDIDKLKRENYTLRKEKQKFKNRIKSYPIGFLSKEEVEALINLFTNIIPLYSKHHLVSTWKETFSRNRIIYLPRDFPRYTDAVLINLKLQKDKGGLVQREIELINTIEMHLYKTNSIFAYESDVPRLMVQR